MTVAGGRGVRADDRRRWHRVKLAVPVQVHAGTEARNPGVCPGTWVSRDVSTGGVYVMTNEKGVFVPDDILKVVIAIPWEAQKLFPFSRIAGLCRVVRVDEPAASNAEGRLGLALAFCNEQVALIGTIRS